ncbi:MAG: phosphatase PAP2 family protein [Euryarchaeota archaeon]|nr:phosphatase PAP2 family protein [Euryarchaeota archaeon]
MPLCDMDVQVLQVLNSCSFLDPLMITLSVVGNLYLWVVIGVLVFWFNGKNVAISYGAVLFITWLIVVFLKSYLMFPRPEDVRVLVEASGYSMPSGHAALSFASAMFLHPLASGKLRSTIWILTILVSISRMFVGVHYPCDVIAGALLGLAIGYGGTRAGRFAESYIGTYVKKR